VLAKQPSDLHTSTATQMAVHRLMCADGFLERHLGRLRDCYRERRDAMATAVDEHFPVGTRRTHPAGGLFLWVELPGEVDTAELLLRALPRHVAFVPGRPFHADGSGAACLRLTFATVSPERIRDGIGRLGRVIEEGAYSPA
jgi:2-aminoadipate transaminase